MKVEKKLLSFVLALAMVITMVPMFGVEAWAESTPISYVEPIYKEANVVTSGVISWSTKTCTEYTVVTSGTIEWNSGWYVVNSNVTINGRITVSGEAVNLILVDEYDLTVTTATLAGIDICDNSSLTIYAGSTGNIINHTGTLSSSSRVSDNHAWGICAGRNSSVTINGGTVTASGISTDPSKYGCGIYGDTNSSIIINGGKLNANGLGDNAHEDSDGYGIYGDSFSVTINGGAVTASGTTKTDNDDGTGYGICGNTNSSVIINDGTVVASGSSIDGDAIGILGYASSITINGGRVVVSGESTNSAGVGISGINDSPIIIKGGTVIVAGKGKSTGFGIYGATNSAITISGGTVTSSGSDAGIYCLDTIKVNEDLILKAGASEISTNLINHTSVTNVATSLSSVDMNYAKIVPAVASVSSGGNTTYYESVQKAVTGASNERIDYAKTVKIMRDVDLTSPIKVDGLKYVTIDLNGHVLNQTTDDAVIANLGYLIIQDSTANNPDRPAHYYTVSNSGIWVWNDNIDTDKKHNAITLGGITSASVAAGTVINVSGGAITGGNGYSYSDECKL